MNKNVLTNQNYNNYKMFMSKQDMTNPCQLTQSLAQTDKMCMMFHLYIGFNHHNAYCFSFSILFFSLLLLLLLLLNSTVFPFLLILLPLPKKLKFLK